MSKLDSAQWVVSSSVIQKLTEQNSNLLTLVKEILISRLNGEHQILLTELIK